MKSVLCLHFLEQEIGDIEMLVTCLTTHDQERARKVWLWSHSVQGGNHHPHGALRCAVSVKVSPHFEGLVLKISKLYN